MKTQDLLTIALVLITIIIVMDSIQPKTSLPAEEKTTKKALALENIPSKELQDKKTQKPTLLFEEKLVKKLEDKQTIKLLSTNPRATITVFDDSGRTIHKPKKGKKYNFEIVLKSKKIKKIVLNDLKVTSDNLSLGINTPRIQNFQSAIAIDPTPLSFSNATITVKASGRSVFKCADWNFTTQSCPSNRWKKIRNLKPGEEYNLTITREDPGFGESNATVDVLDKDHYLIDNNQTIIANNNGIVDVNITIINSTIKTRGMVLRGHNDSSDKKDMIVISELNLSNETRLKDVNAFDGRNLSFKNYTVMLNTTGKKTFECTRWNATTSECLGDWVKVKDHEPGKAYEHLITEAEKAIAESNYSIAFLDAGLRLLSYNETILNRSGDLADAKYELRGLRIKKIIVKKRNESDKKDEITLQHQYNLSELPNFYDDSLRVDPNISFEYAEITINATAKYLYKCLEWNITTESCTKGWRKLKKLVPQQEYVLNITPGDPVFLESNRSLVILNQSGEEISNVNVTVISNNSDVVDVLVELANQSLKNITIENHNYSTNKTVLKIDDFEPTSWASYALDPTQLNFTKATITINASGKQLYKCKDWNFTEQECIGNWTFVRNLTLGQLHAFNLTPDDPGFSEESPAVDVALAPFDFETLVLAFVDEEKEELVFNVLKTNGTIIVNDTVVDATVNKKSRVSVWPINRTHFAIAWVDGPEKDVTLAVFDINGSNVFPPTDVDTNVKRNTDVSVAQLGDRFVVCYANDDDNDADFQIFNNTGTLLVGETSVDDNMKPQKPLQNLIECAGLNRTRWVYFWFDRKDKDATFAVVNETGGIILDQTDIDNDVGRRAQVATTTLDNDKFVLAWFDHKERDITIAIKDANNNTILAPTDIDTDVKKARIAVATIRKNRTADKDSFVLAWFNKSSKSIHAAVFNGTGSTITPPFVVDNNDVDDFLLDVTSRDPITGNSLCPGFFIVAFTNSTQQRIFKGFNVNGSEWDGKCPVIKPFVNITVLSPSPGSVFFINDTVNLTVNATAFPSFVNTVFANITLPNSSVAQVQLFNQSKDVFNATFLSSRLILRGKYNVTFVATDAQGNINTTTSFFVRKARAVIDVTNPQGVPINFSISVTNNVSGLLNLEIIPNHTIETIKVFNHSETSIFGVIKLGTGVNTTAFPFEGSYSTDVSNLNFTLVRVTRNATSGNKLYKCKNFDILLGQCTNLCAGNESNDPDCPLQPKGLWEPILDITPGQAYTFSLTNSTDPGFAEFNTSTREDETNTTSSIPLTAVQANFTPTTTQQLVIGYAEVQGENNTREVRARLVMNDSLIVGNLSWQPDTGRVTDPPGDYQPFFTHKLINLNKVLQNLSVQFSAEAGQNTFVRRARAISLGITDNDALTNESGDSFQQLVPSGTFHSIVNLSFTPTKTQSLLVLASAELLANTTTNPIIARLLVNGTEKGRASLTAESLSDVELFAVHDVMVSAPAGVKQNFTLQAQSASSIAMAVRRARLTVVPLDDGFFAQNRSFSSTNSTSPQNKTVLAFTLNETTNVLVLASAEMNFSTDGNGEFFEGHLFLDDVPVGNITMGASVISDKFSFVVAELRENLSNGSHTARIAFNLGSGALPSRSVGIKEARISIIPQRVIVTNFSNVSAIKTDSPDPALTSTELSYVVNVTSSGNRNASNVTLKDTYPEQVIFLTAQPPPLPGTNNTFVLGNMTPNQSILVNITVFVLNLSNGTVINNTVNVSFQNETGGVLSVAVTESTFVEVEKPKLQLFREQPTGVGTNKVINVRFVVWNNDTSNINATAITIVDDYPPGWKVAGLPQDINATDDGDKVTLNLGPLGVDGLATVNYSIRSHGTQRTDGFSARMNFTFSGQNKSSNNPDLFRIKILEARAVLDVELDLVQDTAVINRTIFNGTSTTGILTLTNVGIPINVGTGPLQYLWRFNRTLWNVTSPSCTGGSITNFTNGFSAINCTFSSFAVGETKNITFTISSTFQNAEEITRSNSSLI